MNIVTSLPPLLAGAIGISGALYGLTIDEREFIACVFARLDQRAEEAGNRAKRILGFIPTEDGLIMAAALMAVASEELPPMKEELLIGLEAQARPEVILAALRNIVRATFPAETAGHMLEVFSN